MTVVHLDDNKLRVGVVSFEECILRDDRARAAFKIQEHLIEIRLERLPGTGECVVLDRYSATLCVVLFEGRRCR